MTIYARTSGVWRTIEQPYVKDSGTWRTVNLKSVKDSGVWRTVFPDVGGLWIWGYNNNGQLGDNTTTNRLTPVTTFAGGANWKQVSAGEQHTAAIKTDGTLWTWGWDIFGALGNNTSFTNRLTPITTFTGGTNWKEVAGGTLSTSAIKTDGTLWTWGFNNNGQLGDNTTTNRLTPVTTFAGGTNWKQVASSGFYSTAAIKTDGTLWIWGQNNSAQLGVNDITNRLTPVTTFAGGTNWKQVACGGYHMAAIKTDGTLWIWGYNSGFQLGINNSTLNISTPVTTFAGGTNWKQVSAGGQHTAAIKTDGTLWTWGTNFEAQLGDNTTTVRSIPVTTFAGGTNWKQVECGNDYTVAIKTDGTLWSWGRNTEGQLGINNLTPNISTPVTTFAGGTNWKQVASMLSHTAAIKT